MVCLGIRAVVIVIKVSVCARRALIDNNIDNRADIKITKHIDFRLFVCNISLRIEAERNSEHFQERRTVDHERSCAIRRKKNDILRSVELVGVEQALLSAESEQRGHGFTVANSVDRLNIVRLADNACAAAVYIKPLTEVDAVGGFGIIRICRLLIEVHDRSEEVSRLTLCKLIIGIVGIRLFHEDVVNRMAVCIGNLHVIECPRIR